MILVAELKRSKRKKRKNRHQKGDVKSTTSSQISTSSIERIIERLKTQQYRDSTRRNYYTVWRIFNKFFIRLDDKPESWEHRLNLFVAHLIDSKRQSSTVKSYVSAIKAVLAENEIEFDVNESLIASLTQACRLTNDHICTRLPIQKEMLRIILEQVDKSYSEQPYLRVLLKTIFSTMYFGLFRIGELTKGLHVVKVRDVNIATNKKKFLFILRTSKTHYKNSKPQLIKISSTSAKNRTNCSRLQSHLPCPYSLLREYRNIRPGYRSSDEQFFVFSDNSPVLPSHIRNCLKAMITLAGFEHPHLYSVHAMRAGRACDLIKLGLTIDQVKKLGRWKSNAIFKYLR